MKQSKFKIGDWVIVKSAETLLRNGNKMSYALAYEHKVGKIIQNYFPKTLNIYRTTIDKTALFEEKDLQKFCGGI